ncbi:MAG: flavin monoamine oxidase family protein [Actinomycetota bacterium]
MAPGRRDATWSRRDVLRAGGALGAGLALGPRALAASGREALAPLERATPHDARVVVVGAGLAGLTAAYRLRLARVRARVFEARARVGGRCWTARGFPGRQHAEHGGEFIDSRHVHLRSLVDELGLELDDLWEAWVPGSAWPVRVDGELVPWRELREQLEPVAEAAEVEARRIGVLRDGRRPNVRAMAYGTATPAAIELDARSMAEWLEEHVPGVLGSPLGSYLDASMAGWYGLEMDRLSACTWIDYFVLPWPGADERWRVRGGNDRVTTRLAERLAPGSLRLEAPLEAMRARANGTYELRFGGVAEPVRADLVILALPFTTLRLVDLGEAGFPADRLAAIRELGMGADVKLLLPYDRRPARFRVGERPWSGGMDHTSPNFQTWESSAGQRGRAGLVTVYAGGRTGEGWSAPTPHGPAPEALAGEIAGLIDEVVPGTGASLRTGAWADLWTRDPWTLGSYAAFLPGQFTRFWGFTGRRERGSHFAGEHTSTHSQGYLNGAVESGERAAAEVLGALRRRAVR